LQTRIRVVHITTSHQPLDVRIFYKECRTLAAAGYEVHLVAPDPPAAKLDGVYFHAVPTPKDPQRFRRLGKRLTCTYAAYQKAAALRARIYHFHDPDLIPAGILLKLRGAKVIYDVHEDYPEEALELNRDNPLWARVQSLGWAALEMMARLVIDRFVCATPAIARKFPPPKTVMVQNYPLLNELSLLQQASQQSAYLDRRYSVIYSGLILAIRGICEMVRALELLPERPGFEMLLLGEFSPPELRSDIERAPGWKRVDFRGWQPREKSLRSLLCARAGLVLFHPTFEHLESYPNKLFEYMAASLPVIASNFPLWRSIVEDAGCGLLVDPQDPRAIAEAIDYLLTHPAEAEAMGARGQQAVRDRYNWDLESQKLLALYRRIEASSRQRLASQRKRI